MIYIALRQYPHHNGHRHETRSTCATKQEVLNVLIDIATRVGLSYAVALMLLAALMMIVNG